MIELGRKFSRAGEDFGRVGANWPSGICGSGKIWAV